MNRKFIFGIRLFSLVVVVALIIGLALIQTGAVNSPPQTGDPHDSVTLSSGLTIRYQEMLKAPKPAVAVVEPKPELPKVGDMAELLRLFNQMGILQKVEKQSWGMDEADSADTGVVYNSVPFATAMPEARLEENAMLGEADVAYSATNTQVAGVDEGDIVKTDGQYLYIAQGTQVSIVRAQGPSMTVASVIELDDNAGVNEMYVSGDRLVLVTGRYEEASTSDTAQGKIDKMIWRPGKSFTGYHVYDVSDRTRPIRVRLFEVEGDALTTRLMGNILYFAASKTIYSVVFDDLEAREDDLLPMYRDTVAAPDVKPVAVEDLCYFPGSLEANYLLLGAFDITGDAPCDVQSFLGAGQYFYMSERSIYIAKPEWDEDGNHSALYRFSVDGENIQYENSGQVAGTPLNQYSMDEYHGYFRIATTDWGRGNYVTVFDGAMNQTGQTPPLAPDESVQSARFMGDRGYVVTYRQTDPLFALDLSDPQNPRVTGELKIPGFSQYLHPIGDDLMAGFGRHTQETFVRDDNGVETPLGAIDVGMKISLFDVSDPENPLEIDKILLGDGSWSEATTNPRAMMVDAARGLFGFPVEISGWNTRAQTQNNDRWNGGLIIGVEDRSLKVRAELRADPDSWGSRRLCYIGETLYLCGQDAVTAYSYEDFVKQNNLSLPQPKDNGGLVILE